MFKSALCFNYISLWMPGLDGVVIHFEKLLMHHISVQRLVKYLLNKEKAVDKIQEPARTGTHLIARD